MARTARTEATTGRVIPWPRTATEPPGVERFLRTVAELEELDPLADRLAEWVTKLTENREVKNLLSGTWMGHPAHPMLTDVPIGAWTSALVLDLVPGRWSRRAADTLVATGILATVPTVATGLNDWADTWGGTRRVGTVHALVNTAALALYTSSLVKRLRAQRVRGFCLGAMGWATLVVGGYLGGHLAYRRGVGVDENVFVTKIGDWRPAIALDDLPEGELRKVTVDEVDIVLFRSGQRIYALANRCGHLGGPLDEGHAHAEDLEVSCPWHHSTFSLESGRVSRGPASAPQSRFETRLRDGTVEVRSPAEP